MLNDMKPVSGQQVQIVASGGDYGIQLHGGGLYEFFNVATGQVATITESCARVLIESMVSRGITSDADVGKYLERHAQAALVQRTELAVLPDALDEWTRKGVANLVNRAAAENAAEAITETESNPMGNDSIGHFFEWLDQRHGVFHDLDNDIMVITARDFVRAVEERYGELWYTFQAAQAAQNVARPRPTVEVASTPVAESRSKSGVNSEYDKWLKIGQRLFHAFEGDNDGLRMWHDWSNLVSSSSYDPKAVDDKWRQFGETRDICKPG